MSKNITVLKTIINEDETHDFGEFVKKHGEKRVAKWLDEIIGPNHHLLEYLQLKKASGLKEYIFGTLTHKKKPGIKSPPFTATGLGIWKIVKKYNITILHDLYRFNFIEKQILIEHAPLEILFTKTILFSEATPLELLLKCHPSMYEEELLACLLLFWRRGSPYPKHASEHELTKMTLDEQFYRKMFRRMYVIQRMIQKLPQFKHVLDVSPIIA